MSIRWVEGARGEVYIGLIGHGLRISITKFNEGWWVEFAGQTLQRPYGTLTAAQWDGVELAKKILTDCLINLADDSSTPRQ